MFKFSKIHKIVVLGCMLLLVACKGEQKKAGPENNYENENLYSDDFVLEDTTGADFSGEPYSMGLDGSFDDFVFAYAANKEFQKQRTQFPLWVIDIEKGDTVLLEKSEWNDDSLFPLRNFYTIMYDKEEDMEFVSEPNLIRAQVESIYLEDKLTKVYHFLKENDIWMLHDITLNHLEEYRNEEFVNFYKKFANDSVFQTARLAETLEYVTSDPNDDFEILETSLTPEDWCTMRPMLPGDRLLNINYGQVNSPLSTMKILAVKGIGTGFSNVFFFRLNSKEKWELFKFDDVGV